jgi:hypothetical protein
MTQAEFEQNKAIVLAFAAKLEKANSPADLVGPMAAVIPQGTPPSYIFSVIGEAAMDICNEVMELYFGA